MADFFILARFYAVFEKELIQMSRDRVTFAMMLFIPLLQLVLFGYAINSDPKQLPSALLALSQDPYSRAIVSKLEQTDYFRFDYIVDSEHEAETLLEKGEVSFVVTIPSDFSRRVQRKDQALILIDVDATDPAISAGPLSSIQPAVNRAIAELSTQSSAHLQAGEQSAVSIIVHKRYNPQSITQYNIVPGLLGVILQMTMVMMTSMALTRETERGTMENLLSMPTTPFEIMLGKVLPYLSIGAVQVGVILIAAHLLFSVPFVGSLSLLLCAVLLFVMALVLLGYFISTVAGSQMQAMQLTFFFFLPSLLLSGFMFPFKGMPQWAQILGEAFPLTHFLRVVRAVMLKGAEFNVVASEMFALSAFVVLFALIAMLRFKPTLD
ncbi:ABC transporter permease [Glaciecola siphonariae]|uniref:ABC transporter permease n=1 Tax=Glaciecola siphonariae TaxID=521012 RepID=A0ABV9LQU7_9ALTE